MLTHVIIKLIGVSRYSHPRHAGHYLYTQKYNGYVWKGRALTLEELNKEKKAAIDDFDHNAPYFPTVEAVVAEEEEVVVERKVVVEEVPEDPTDTELEEVANDLREENEENGTPPYDPEDDDSDKPVSYQHKGGRRYDVYNAAGEVVTADLSLVEAKKLVPDYDPKAQQDN